MGYLDDTQAWENIFEGDDVDEEEVEGVIEFLEACQALSWQAIEILRSKKTLSAEDKREMAELNREVNETSARLTVAVKVYAKLHSPGGIADEDLREMCWIDDTEQEINEYAQ